MTTEELLALPEDGIDRELICGVLCERKSFFRNPAHAIALASIGGLLETWSHTRPEPQGETLGFGVAYQIRTNPDTIVQIDVSYISAETAAAIPPDAEFIDGPPVLAVEILSPFDRQGDITDKIREYLECGVKLIWIAEPVFRTICVYRPDVPPEMFNDTQELSGEPHLPDFRAAVSELFGD